MADLAHLSVQLDVTIRDLREGDLAGLGWSGDPGHLAAVAEELTRAKTGAVEYLVACLPTGASVGKGGVDYERYADAGFLWQLAVREPLHSFGIGTALVRACEARIAARGRTRSEVRAELDNPRAKELYERLGYVAYGTEPDGWNVTLPDGSVTRYETTCTMLRKQLIG